MVAPLPAGTRRSPYASVFREIRLRADAGHGAGSYPWGCDPGTAGARETFMVVRNSALRMVEGGRLGFRGLLQASDVDLALAVVAFGALLADPA